MTVVVNKVRGGFYLDSVALMRLSAQLSDAEQVHEAVLMIGSENNKRIMADAGLLTETGEAATANDLVIALRASDGDAAQAAIETAYASLDQQTAPRDSGRRAVGSLSAALQELPGANLALISTPGEYAAREAGSALARGLNVMIFSDNVALADEVTLKQRARELDLIVLGPDCGTALIGGQPLAFCNVVPRGDIGIVAASGTGLQEVMCLLARHGAGVSQGIGVGGRDLHDEVGAISTMTALDLLADDALTRQVVLISKPPGPQTAARVYGQMAELGKPAVVCTFGMHEGELPSPLRAAETLQHAAELCLATDIGGAQAHVVKSVPRGRSKICGLYSGGTLCSEALAIFQRAGVAVASNIALRDVPHTDRRGHRFIDLGADEFTVGRPHPMIDPQVRIPPLREALQDPEVAVIVLDIVLGYGAHEDPAGAVLDAIAAVPAADRPAVVTSVCGTDADPQNRAAQVAALQSAGVAVAESNAEAARWALQCVSGG